MFLPKFDIYQDKIAPNCFKSYTSPRCPYFFQDKSFNDIWSEIYIVRRNMFSNEQSVRVWNNIFRPEFTIVDRT